MITTASACARGEGCGLLALGFGVPNVVLASRCDDRGVLRGARGQILAAFAGSEVFLMPT